MEYLTLKNILVVVLVIIIAVYGIMTGKVIEWLKGMVALAEQELGTGTGQLKLRQVYNKFIVTFPKFAVIVPFPIFSKMVDVALEWLNTQLSQNKDIKNLISGE